MEKDLMEKLLKDFNGTLDEFNKLVRDNDIEAIKRVFDEVNRLIAQQTGIVLDDREPDYDHVLHELLFKMTGIVEKDKEIEGFDNVKGARYYTNEEVEKKIEEKNLELTEILATQNEEKIAEITKELELLRNSIIEGQEYSSYIYIDEDLKVLQEERASLFASKKSVLEEIEELSKEENKEDEIKELKDNIQELENQMSEIEKQIANFSGVVDITESMDISKEAHIIGDHIFKTATIRRELAERDVTREEFLEFYKAGLIQTQEQINQYEAERRDLFRDLELLTEDRIDKRIEEAKEENDEERLMELYDELRDRFVMIDDGLEMLTKAGIPSLISQKEDLEKMEIFWKEYQKHLEEADKQKQDSIVELYENYQIFSKEVERIKNEKETLEMTGDTEEELEEKANERKEQRRALLEASITPKSELTEEQSELLNSWQEASERFLNNKTSKEYKYIDKDGKYQVLEVDTIDDTYEGYLKDAQFLGVPAYKENLEQVSAWEQTKDPYVFGEEVGLAYDEAEAEREGAGEAVINRIIADKKKYVETFNGIPNPHKVKYETWKTAGSTLKGMKPVDRDLPMPTRVGNFIENTFRFFGIRKPEFSRFDNKGNKVKDIKGGLTTLAIDAAVIAGVGAAIVTVGPGLAVAGYAAKGLVTIGNRIAAKIEYSKHKDEIDNNKPVINQAGKDAREVARKEYYREQGNNRFVSWVKAKSDKYFTKKRGKETEKAIVDKLASEYSENEDKRTETLKKNLKLAQSNQEARMKRQKQVAMGANTYNDIVRDPDLIDKDEAVAAIARNAALGANGVEGIEDINKKSQVERKSNYVKEEQALDKTEDLDKTAFEVKGRTSAVTEEQIYTGRKQKVDRANKVLTIITAAGLKFGYTAWKDGFIKEDIIHHEAEYKDEVIHHEAEYKDIEVPEYETRFDTNATLEEIMKNNQGKNFDGHYSVSGGIKGTSTRTIDNDNITAMWVDDKSAWGTGISDSQGLSAPVLTDRLAGADLLDANGLLRQDLTVQELLDATGSTVNDLSNLDGIYVSVGDKYWASLSDLMKGMTKEVQVGTHIETQLVSEARDEVIQTLVKPAWDETVKTFSSGKVIETLRDGAIIGAGIGLVDQIHETAQTTYIDGAIPGSPDEVTPEASDDTQTIIDKLLAEAEKERALNAEQELDENDIEIDDEEFEMDGEETSKDDEGENTKKKEDDDEISL